MVLASSVYLRDLRPPPAGAAAPREPGPEVWGEPRVVPAPSRPAQREKGSGVGLRRCRRGRPLLGLTLRRRATSRRGTASSGILILVAAETEAVGAALWRGGRRAGGGARVRGWADRARRLD